MGLTDTASAADADTIFDTMGKHAFSASVRFRFDPHPYGMRLKPEGLSYELKKCPPDTSLPGLRPGRSFESLPVHQKWETPDGVSHFWYAGRDSNPQPSEPESDALSIEPPAHLLYSLNIIARIFPFVKRETEIFQENPLRLASAFRKGELRGPMFFGLGQLRVGGDYWLVRYSSRQIPRP